MTSEVSLINRFVLGPLAICLLATILVSTTSVKANTLCDDMETNLWTFARTNPSFPGTWRAEYTSAQPHSPSRSINLWYSDIHLLLGSGEDPLGNDWQGVSATREFTVGVPGVRGAIVESLSVWFSFRGRGGSNANLKSACYLVVRAFDPGHQLLDSQAYCVAADDNMPTPGERNWEAMAGWIYQEERPEEYQPGAPYYSRNANGSILPPTGWWYRLKVSPAENLDVDWWDVESIEVSILTEGSYIWANSFGMYWDDLCIKQGGALAFTHPKIATYYPCGGSYPLDLWVHDVPDLVMFDICAGFDGTRVAFDEVAPATFLATTGGTVEPYPVVPCDPSCNTAGMTYGFYALGGSGAPSGSGSLGVISFSRLGDGDGTDAVCLEDWQLVTSGVPPEIVDVSEATGTSIKHQPFCYGDFDDDADIDPLDHAQVLNRCPSYETDPGYDETYDVNLVEEANYCLSWPDGWIDIEDVQAVADRVHKGCPTGGAVVATSGPQTSPVVRMQPESLVICGTPGTTASFDIVVAGAQNLGAFQTFLYFDPSVIKIQDIVPGAMLGKTGRTPVAIGPSEYGEPGKAYFAVSTTGDAAGADGDGVLATVTVTVQAADAATEVAFGDVKVTNPSGWRVTDAEVFGGTIRTQGGSAGLPDGQADVPGGYILYPARPNPLSGSTVIPFAIPGSDGPVTVTMAIYSVSGQRVKTVVERPYGPGYHQAEWDGLDKDGLPVAPGVYFCHMKAGNHCETRRLSVVR
jgi:hypothetical protein